jgi:hypothetical protein
MEGGLDTNRLKQLLLTAHERPKLEELKRQVRGWHSSGAPGQDAINRAVVRAIDDLHARMDVLLKI